MDVSVDIHQDPKFRRVAREHPDLVAAVFTVYLAVLAASWKAGERVSLDDAWPVLLPFDEEVSVALRDCGLLDSRGRIAARAWRSWYAPAFERRERRRQSGSLGGHAAHGLPREGEDRERSDGRATLGRRSGNARPVPFRSDPVRPGRSDPGDGQTREEVLSDVV
jgi:hypothetical protein